MKGKKDYITVNLCFLNKGEIYSSSIFIHFQDPHSDDLSHVDDRRRLNPALTKLALVDQPVNFHSYIDESSEIHDVPDGPFQFHPLSEVVQTPDLFFNNGCGRLSRGSRCLIVRASR